MQELLTQIDHRLAILPPEVLKNLSCLDLHRLGLILELLSQLMVLLVSLSQLSVLGLQLLVHLADPAMERCILGVEHIKLVSQLIQVKQAILFCICKLRSELENLLVQRCDLCLELLLLQGVADGCVPIRLIDSTELVLAHLTHHVVRRCNVRR